MDVYPMFNAAHITDGVDYAPHMFGFARQGGALIGKRSQRATRKGNTCTIRTQAKITCADNRLTLSYRPMPAIDWARCKATTAKPVRTLTLSR